eukprot:CAMPEP_0172467598 /NCGR_PEP_ID=MMETSP1065-20121228/59370_1 /TAXON_ID=265537 /ORGANISM="Amphiprora paludosa, Strain CCMP125" /LENGTH=88 /DNA_ID=CAMNT_0013224781 /DNA_START=42 /DNA_END=305 /DNA_ORIENTATION=+
MSSSASVGATKRRNNNNTNTTTNSSSNSSVTSRQTAPPRLHHPNSAGARIVEELQREQAAIRATVRRQFCGTGPFDHHWLNVDCCGLT